MILVMVVQVIQLQKVQKILVYNQKLIYHMKVKIIHVLHQMVMILDKIQYNIFFQIDQVICNIFQKYYMKDLQLLHFMLVMLLCNIVMVQQIVYNKICIKVIIIIMKYQLLVIIQILIIQKIVIYYLKINGVLIGVIVVILNLNYIMNILLMVQRKLLIVLEIKINKDCMLIGDLVDC